MVALNGVSFDVKVHISQPNPLRKASFNYRWDHHLYIHFEGESIIDQLFNRRHRPYQMYKKEVIPIILKYMEQHYPEVYEKIKDTKWQWSQKCGCTLCPCSPGFHGQTNILAYHISVSLSKSK